MSCENCHQDCLNCETSQICLTCKDLNSEPGIIGCDCYKGYFKNPSQSGYTCENCLDECSECDQNSTCLTCKANYTYLDNSKRCICDSGYYITIEKNCINCTNNCSTCTLSKTNISEIECISCIDNFELVNKTCQPYCNSNEKRIEGKCECIIGYSRIENNCVREKFHLKFIMSENNMLFLY